MSPARRIRRTSRIPGYVFSGIGAALLIPGLFVVSCRAHEILSWTETQATVVESHLETDGSQHSLRLTVEYRVDHETVVTAPRHDFTSPSYATIAEAAERLAPGTRIPVFHAGGNPREARLNAGFNLETFGASLLLAGLGAVFAVVGALAWRSAVLSRAAEEDETQAGPQQVLLIATFVGAVGLAFAVAAAGLVPSARRESDWPPVMARVERSDVYTRSVARHKGRGSGVSYVGRLFLVWEWAGRPYRGVLDETSDNDRSDVEAVLAGIPPGTLREIRVDPEHPYRTRAVDSWPWVLPLVFAAAGVPITTIAAMLMGWARNARPPRRRR